MKKLTRIHVKNLKDEIGEEVRIAGFVHTIRDQGNIKFVIVRDITGIVQCVVLKDSEAFNLVSSLSLESVIEVFGNVKEEKQAPEGFEIEAKSIVVLSDADANLPIPVIVEKSGGETDVSKRFDWRWIDLRKPMKHRIFEVWTSLEKGFRDYFYDNGYIQVYSPTFMSTPSESGSDVFEVEYFEKKAYLAQSPQFYKQAAMAAGLERIFMTGPVFRAELSFTTRHTTEFTGWDFEISYIDSHHDVISEEEKMIVEGFKKVKGELSIDLNIPETPFPKITFENAKRKLKENGITSDKVNDFSPDEERGISEIIKKEQGHDFVFIIDYPIEARPFYHMRHEDNPKITKSFDLLYKGMEITTGAQREHRVKVLESQAEEKGMDLSLLSDYLNFFRYGCPPHGGGGIGPGRIVMKILDLASVKEATFLPRDVKRLTP